MRRCLVGLFGPHNVLPAACAVRWHGELARQPRPSEVVTVVHAPGAPGSHQRESGAQVERMMKGLSWGSRVVVLTDDDMRFILEGGGRRVYRDVIARFVRAVGGGPFQEVYYPHDLVGRLAELCTNAYPEAHRVTFGDGLGQIYDPKYVARSSVADVIVSGVLADLAGYPLRWLGRIRERIGKLRSGGPWKYRAQTATLILPMDYSGRSLRRMALEVVPKPIVLDTIAALCTAFPELEGRISQTPQRTVTNRFLILLANLSDAGFTDVDAEIQLYSTIVRAHCPRGAHVLIKAHPLSVAPVAARLAERLRDDYVATELSKPLSVTPIELCRDLIAECEVISCASTTVGLAYLYEKRVNLALTGGLIDAFISPNFRKLLQDAETMYRGQLENLSRWDGQSVLWRGPI
jgi:hypothetical protein